MLFIMDLGFNIFLKQTSLCIFNIKRGKFFFNQVTALGNRFSFVLTFFAAMFSTFHQTNIKRFKITKFLLRA